MYPNRRSIAADFNRTILLLMASAIAGCTTMGDMTQPHRLHDFDRDGVKYEEAGSVSDAGSNLSPDGTPLVPGLTTRRVSNSSDELNSPNRMVKGSEAVSHVSDSRSPKRQMIYTAEFAIATPNVNQSIDTFIGGVKAMGGYLESRKDNRVVVRVPADSFDRVVHNMSSLGEVLSRSIQNEDATRQHRDLQLRIQTLAASHKRLLDLLNRAENIEDIVKLEEQLRQLTLELETAQGQFKTLGEQVAYSRVEVDFRTKSVEAVTQRNGKSSAFAWINDVGADRLANDTLSVDAGSARVQRKLATMLPGAVDVPLPDEFLVVEHSRKELKAVTANDARLRVRKLEAPKNGTLDFWSNALVSHLVNNRGYELVEERRIRDDRKRQGRELTFDVVTGGVPTRYLTTLFVEELPFWSRSNAIQVTEFVAPQEQFDEHVAGFHASGAWQVTDMPGDWDPEMVTYGEAAKPDVVRGQTWSAHSGRAAISSQNAR